MMCMPFFFRGTEKLPSVRVTDSEFDSFLAMKGCAVGQEDSSPASTYPTRSQKPSDVYQVQHCVAYNVIMVKPRQLTHTNYGFV